MSEDFEELGYCCGLRYVALPEFREKYHRWPKNLGEVEKDREAKLGVIGRWSNRWFYFKYRPVMTVLEEGKSYILIRVQFTGWDRHAENVEAGDE